MRVVRGFWSRVEKTGDCWLWTGPLNNTGYGTLRAEKQLEGVHRYSFRIHHGKIPPGMYVLHRCGNRNCVRPEHLYVGTQRQNMKDRERDGTVPRGENHKNSKLTDGQISDLRSRYSQGGLSQEELGKLYGICQQQVSKLVNQQRRACG